MGNLIKEYGKLFVLVLLSAGLLGFLIGNDEVSLFKNLHKAAPKAAFMAGSNLDMVAKEANRPAPVLTVIPQKLTAGRTYDFKVFVSEAYDAEGNSLEIKLPVMIGPKGEVIPEGRVQAVKGIYTVTYQVVDSHRLSTQKQVCFAVD